MSEKLLGLFLDYGNRFVGYLPKLFLGILLLGMGWFLAWVAKRIIVQLCVILKMEYFLTRFAWGRDFSKADLRFGFYNLLGNVAFIIVFLVFLDFTLITWDLPFLSNLLADGILVFPRVAAALILFGVGWLIALQASRALRGVLWRGDIPFAPMISNYVRIVIILFFVGMALAQLNIAREIVVIGFAVVFITMGGIAVVLTAILGKKLLRDREEGHPDDQN
jgi:Mechanosensitive ion channel, conserved TM helix